MGELRNFHLALYSRTMDHQSLHLGEKLYQSPFNQMSGVFKAEMDDESVIVKRRSRPMERELYILRSLNYTLFPEVKAYFQQDDTYNLVLEKKAGVPLNQWIHLNKDWRSSIRDVSESTNIIRELALGLVALRDFGYYYRDLSLGHVLIDNGRVTALVDHEADVRVGTDGSATVDTHIGTWETMAPEEFTIGDKMTEASTTYSLAVILYQLTHGRSLFHLPHIEGKTVEEMRMLSRESHFSAPDPENITHHQYLFKKALQVDPSQRYQTLEEFLSDID